MRRSHLAASVLIVYAIALVLAAATGLGWLEALATILLTSLLLWPALKNRSTVALALLFLVAIATAALAISGRGNIAFDLMPVIVNVALCTLFARTLAPDREPLIARVIAVLESPDRLALPRVATYARALTLAWALFLGAQAIVLAIVVLCRVPDGLLPSFGVTPPIALRAPIWHAYLELGSYAGVLALLVAEYLYRHWHLRHIDHIAFATFIARLVRRWPALARSVMHDAPSRDDA